jgi:hypothetical protein
MSCVPWRWGLFLSIRTKRGFRAVNVAEILQIEFRRATAGEPGDEDASLQLTCRVAIDDDGTRVVRIKGPQAAAVWRLLQAKSLLLASDADAPEAEP